MRNDIVLTNIKNLEREIFVYDSFDSAYFNYGDNAPEFLTYDEYLSLIRRCRSYKNNSAIPYWLRQLGFPTKSINLTVRTSTMTVSSWYHLFDEDDLAVYTLS